MLRRSRTETSYAGSRRAVGIRSARPPPAWGGPRDDGGHRARLPPDPAHEPLQFFNNILFVIGITLLLLGRPTDALISVGVGLLSAVISSVQEVLGKRKLDRLRVIDGDGVAVVRRDPAGGGVEQRVPLAEVVRGDLLPLVGGAQIVVDGPLVTGRVEVDESLGHR